MIQLGSIAAIVGSARSGAIARLAIKVGLRVHAWALQRHWVRLSCHLLYPGQERQPGGAEMLKKRCLAQL